MRTLVISFFLLAVLSSTAQTGPGGVGSSATNQLWLMANTGVYTDGGSTDAANTNNIQQWNDQSGNGRNAIQLTLGNRPNYQTGVMNGLPVIRFTNANNDRMLSAGLTSANAASVWVVASYTSLPSPNPGLIQGSPSGLAYTSADKNIGMWVASTSPFRAWGRGIQTDGTSVNLSNTTGTPTTAGTVYLYLNQYNGTNAITQYLSGSVSSTVPYNGTLRSWTDMAIGNQSGTEGWNGDIAEVIAYNTSVNSAQRIIIDNYLAAKYGLTGASNIANDFYKMDEPTNGDFDYDVAGIGQVDGSNFHNDSQGKSFLRIQYPSNLENGEYFFWGHNNLAAQANNTADVPAGVTARFDRVWRVSETGEVGTLDLLFDLSGLPDFSSLPTCDAASSIRLLVDTNNDGLFADQTPISGATNVGGNVYRFANMGPINNNYRFTIGVVSTGVTGPGGVGGTNGTTNLKLWMDAGKGVVAPGNLVSNWVDQSGNSNIASGTAGNQPTFVSGALNAQPVINFNASNKSLHLSTNINTTTPTAFFVANKPAAGTTYMTMLTLQQNTWLAQGSGVDQWGMRLTPDALSGVTLNSAYRIMTTLERNFNDVDFYTDESVVNKTNGTAYLGKALGTIGANNAGTIGTEIENFNGNIAEIIVFNTILNSTQRIIVDNYLAAKYGLSLTTNEKYLGDDFGYDFEVAGIGQVGSSNSHKDAKGTGLVRVSNASSLGDGDFFMWGHNNLATVGSITDVPATVDARWSREWYVTETGEVGNIDMQFDLSGQGSITASDLRLIIDHDGDGIFNEVGTIVISGATPLSCNNYLFTGVSSINNGMGFTIGTVNRVQTPLPITLVSFNGRINDGVTELTWSTATEHNNDFFTVERSEDGEQFIPVATVRGAGQSIASRNYTATDNFPPAGKIYYRLKQTDFDKEFSYSKIIVVDNIYAEPKVIVSPNPVRIGADLNVKILHSKNNEIGFALYDMLGKAIITTYEQDGNSFTIKTSNAKAAGFYILRTYSTNFNSYQRVYLTE